LYQGLRPVRFFSDGFGWNDFKRYSRFADIDCSILMRDPTCCTAKNARDRCAPVIDSINEACPCLASPIFQFDALNAA